MYLFILYQHFIRNGDSDPRKTMLASATRIYKRQTRPLVREDAHEIRAVIVKD
jgi:hypothetical protein